MLTTPVLALLGIGAGAAILLAVASRLLRVEENPTIELIAEALPGANCGGCGFAGCEAYAAAVVTNEDIPANLCSVGGAEVAARVGELSGKVAAAGEPLVAFRRCSRVEGKVQPRFSYVGTQTCASAAMLEGGPFMCSWACLGLGDCVRICPFDAMYIADGMVEIIASKCMSCGQCVKVCPRGITQLIPRRARVMIHCSTREKLKSVSDVCEVGCINCLKCLKACPAEAVGYEKGRVEINHEVCLAYGSVCAEACVGACLRGIMHRHAPAPALAPVSIDPSEPDAPIDCELYPESPDSVPCESVAPNARPASDLPAPEFTPLVSPSGKTSAPPLAESMAGEDGRKEAEQ
ncbi:MAG: Fe-S cluster domain-containing protein [Desulfovibrio sp.]|jgi:electron transport complex protein RnfB|nr:Fe-S cluster domain-containing protein [Desulfovibrio sp.]